MKVRVLPTAIAVVTEAVLVTSMIMASSETLIERFPEGLLVERESTGLTGFGKLPPRLLSPVVVDEQALKKSAAVRMLAKVKRGSLFMAWS